MTACRRKKEGAAQNGTLERCCVDSIVPSEAIGDVQSHDWKGLDLASEDQCVMFFESLGGAHRGNQTTVSFDFKQIKPIKAAQIICLSAARARAGL